MIRRTALALGVCAATLVPSVGYAGPVFLTGHDPDFHAQAGAGQNLLRAGLSYASGGSLPSSGHKLLWVESFLPATSGHLIGAQGLGVLGLTLGTDYDRVDAVGFASVSLSGYAAIGVASSFGGMFTAAELNAMIARSADIAAFINAGGGLFASAECDSGGSCDASNMAAPHGSMYGYLPVSVTSISDAPPFHVTAFGAAAPFNLTDADVNDPTHNSFGAIGGLTPIDLDSGSPAHATTLAGVVRIEDGTIVPTTPVPEPASLLLLGSGLVAGIRRLRKEAAGR